MIFQRLAGNEMFRHSALLMLGMMAVHGCNMLFQMTVSRVLPGIEYALLTAFLGIISIINYPLTTFTSSLGHYCSLMKKDHRAGDIKRLLAKWCGLTGVIAIGAGALMMVYSNPIAAFFHLDRPAPIVIAGGLLPGLFWFAVLGGAAQGLQLFGLTSTSNIIGALTKLLIGAGLVWFWHPACGWAMLGQAAGIYVSILVVGIGLISSLRNRNTTDQASPSLRIYLAQSLGAQIGFALLMNADVILVKHLAPEETEFSYAATLGRIVIFLPMSIAYAMFPKVASSGAYTAHHRRYFNQCLMYTGIFVAVATFACVMLPELLLRLLFGIIEPSDHVVSLTRMMALAMTSSALLNVSLQFLLAQRRFGATILPAVIALMYVVGSILWRGDAMSIAIASLLANTFAFVASLIPIMRLKTQSEEPHS